MESDYNFRILGNLNSSKYSFSNILEAIGDKNIFNRLHKPLYLISMRVYSCKLKTCNEIMFTLVRFQVLFH